MAVVSWCWTAVRPAAAAASAARSCSVPDRVFGIAPTISRSAAPTDAARADADPPPGVGSVDAKAARSSRNGRSVNTVLPAARYRTILELPGLAHRAFADDAAVLDDGAD